MPSPTPALTEREQTLYALISAGRTQAEAAETLGISQPRVAQLAKSLRAKLNGSAPAPTAASPLESPLSTLPLQALLAELGTVTQEDRDILQEYETRRVQDPALTWATLGPKLGIGPIKLMQARARLHAAKLIPPLPPLTDARPTYRLVSQFFSVAHKAMLGEAPPDAAHAAAHALRARYDNSLDPLAAAMLSPVSQALQLTQVLQKLREEAPQRAHKAAPTMQPPGPPLADGLIAELNRIFD